MKISLIRVSALLLIVAMIACSKKAETTETTTAAASDEWPEMDSFHMVMAEAFHPYKDSTNLEPAKKLAAEMATSAEQWQAAPLPEKVNNDDVKAKLVTLKNDTRAFADGISGMTDEQIGKSLTALHDSFHGLMEAWHGGGDKHEH
ncbi:MAG: hypothetical protein HOP08_14570 [Cyclobacteriaceae bacterium]|nr:hypothetical protein [Cyclobacteriaceae bacterium]